MTASFLNSFKIPTQNKIPTQISVLQESASTVGWHVNIDDMISGVGKEKLLQNTEEALNRGSFGVPRLV